MIKGSNYVQTDYYRNQAQRFYFTIKSKNTTTMKATVEWHLGTVSKDTTSPTYFLCQGTQTLSIDAKNGKGLYTAVSMGTTQSYRGYTAYNGFCDPGCWLDKNYGINSSRSSHAPYWDTNGDYTGIQRYVYCYGWYWKSGTFITDIDKEGYIHFRAKGNFAWFNSTRRTFDTEFKVRALEDFEISFSSEYENCVGMNKYSFEVPSTVTKKAGVPITLSESKYGVKGEGLNYYTFKYWVDDNGETYTLGSNYTTDCMNTLKAVYEPKRVKVRMHFEDCNNFKPFNLDRWYTDDGVLKRESSISPISTDNQVLEFDLRYGDIYSLGHTPLPQTYSYNKYENKGDEWKKFAYNPIMSDFGMESIGDIELCTTFQNYRGMNIELTPDGINDYAFILTKVMVLDSDGNIRLEDGELVTDLYPHLDFKTFNLYFFDGEQRVFDLDGKQVKYGSFFTYDDCVYDKEGCKLLGWTNIKDYAKIYNPNELSEEEISNILYLDMRDSNNDKVRLWDIYSNTDGSNTDDINMYGVFEWSSTMYVYTNGEWKLALPYVYTNGEWKLSLGYGYVGEWKI